MFKFRKAGSDVLNDLDEYLQLISYEPVRWLERQVRSWCEFSYDELADLIASGDTQLINWQSRYAQVVNERFNPLWLSAIQAASHAATRGRITIDDSDPRVKEFLRTRAAEFVRELSDESKRAVANVILYGQSERMSYRQIAQLVRPLIGLNSRQVQANVNYRQRIYSKLIDAGLSPSTADTRAGTSASKYAVKQHRFRAETIVHTELARAYNQGAYDGVKAAIDARLMSHCEMVWSTAGTNRVCGRCLSLKDTVVGRTDEVGVTLPPLHPRCRCVIVYREAARPTNSRPNLAVPEIQILTQAVMKPNNPPRLNALLKFYATNEYVTVDKAAKIPTYYDIDANKIVYNPNHPAWKYYDPTTAFAHEVMHLIDVENGTAVSLSGMIFNTAQETRRLIFERREHYEQLLTGDLGLNMSVSDLIAAITDSRICGAYAHDANYWRGLGHVEREIVANLATIYYTDDAAGMAFIESLSPLKTLFEEVKRRYEANLDTFSRRRIGINASRSRRISERGVVLSA